MNYTDEGSQILKDTFDQSEICGWADTNADTDLLEHVEFAFLPTNFVLVEQPVTPNKELKRKIKRFKKKPVILSCPIEEEDDDSESAPSLNCDKPLEEDTPVEYADPSPEPEPKTEKEASTRPISLKANELCLDISPSQARSDKRSANTLRRNGSEAANRSTSGNEKLSNRQASAVALTSYKNLADIQSKEHLDMYRSRSSPMIAQVSACAVVPIGSIAKAFDMNALCGTTSSAHKSFSPLASLRKQVTKGDTCIIDSGLPTSFHPNHEAARKDTLNRLLPLIAARPATRIIRARAREEYRKSLAVLNFDVGRNTDFGLKLQG